MRASPIILTLLLGGCLIPVAPRQGSQPGRAPNSAPASSAPASSAAAAPSGPANASARPASTAAPATPQVVSVTLKNECRETVKVCYCDKPKFGSGTRSTLGSNVRTSKSFKPGDMIWLTDDSQNGLASVTIDERTSYVEVGSDCSSLSSR